MSLNLLDLVKDQVTSGLAKEASSFLGESESGITKALGGIMPALLGSTIQKAQSPSGAQGIMDMISKLDLNDLSNIAGVFGGGPSKVNSVMNSGGGIIESLLGNKTSGLIDMIANMSGLKSSSSSSLLKLAAPFLMGLIGKQVQGKGLGFLTDLLMGQKSQVASAMPAGLSSVLGFGSGFEAPKVNVNTNYSTSSNDDNGGGGMGWLKWLLPLLLAAGALWWFTKDGCNKKVEETVVEAVDTTAATIDTMAAKVSNFFEKTLSSGFALKNASKDGIESQLVMFVEDTTKAVSKDLWFNFDRLLFDTGKATLQATSQEQLVNISEILKAFPKVKLKLGGYTDNVGNAASNLKLSTDRAFNVMNELVKLGVEKGRLSAEGYGDKHSIGDNNTEEGRQQNRRIAVRVTEK